MAYFRALPLKKAFAILAKVSFTPVKVPKNGTKAADIISAMVDGRLR
jgi:hypothetical protein